MGKIAVVVKLQKTPRKYRTVHTNRTNLMTFMFGFGSMFALNDDNTWYYPSHGHESDGDNPPVYREYGNWGKKMSKGARWVHRGKMTAWGPEMEDWEESIRALVCVSTRSL
jgi:hypothetical protein